MLFRGKKGLDNADTMRDRLNTLSAQVIDNLTAQGVDCNDPNALLDPSAVKKI